MGFILHCYLVFYGVLFLLLLGIISGPVFLYKTNRLTIQNLILFMVLYSTIVYLLLYKIQYKVKNRLHATKHLKLIQKGTWVNVYEHPTNPNLVVKQWKSPYCTKVYLGSPVDASGGKFTEDCFDKCGRGWGLFTNAGTFDRKNGTCNGLQYVFWVFNMCAQWGGLLRKKELSHIPIIAKIHHLDEENLLWSEEKCEGKMSIDKCPVNFQKDLHYLNEELRKRKAYIYDVHFKNVMLKNGRGKIVDGEILTEYELFMGNSGYSLIRGFKCIPYRDYDRIYWVNEPTRIPLDACYRRDYSPKQQQMIRKFASY